MGWSIKLKNNATLCEGEGAISPGSDPNVITPTLKDKIQEAVRLVPLMAGTGKMCLKRALQVNKEQRATNQGCREVREALHKYFTLRPDDPNWETLVSRIAVIYEQAAKGLCNAQGYNLYVYKVSPGEAHYDANAYVLGSELPSQNIPGKREKTLGSSAALGRFFLVNEDQHWPWDEVQKLAVEGIEGTWLKRREIHLNYEYLIKDESTPDIIAKTILHEATHKWAYTSDVCYKASTYSVKQETDQSYLERQIRQGFLERVERANERQDGKSLIAFSNQVTGKEKKIPTYVKNALQTAANMWVKNADSYAWAARRLWKHDSLSKI